MTTRSFWRAAGLGLLLTLTSAGIGWSAAHRLADRPAAPDPHPPLALMRR
jgi:hypothetical protein